MIRYSAFAILFLFVSWQYAIGQIRLLQPDSTVRPIPGKVLRIVWNSPGSGWTYDVRVRWSVIDEVEIATGITDTTCSWSVPADASGAIHVSVVGHSDRGVQY
jgi:hypothetical protein